jgi:hypothetical protein
VERDLEASIKLSGDGKGKNSVKTENNDEDSDNDELDSMPGASVGEDQSWDFEMDDDINLDARELLALLKPDTKEGRTTEPSATAQSGQTGIQVAAPDWNF